MTSERLEYKGRTIAIDIPEAVRRTEDHRCDECRANNVAVCHHHAADHHEPPRQTPAHQTTIPGHEHAHPPATPGHEHHHDPATEHYDRPDQTAPDQSHGGHGGAFKVTVDGQSFDAHVLRDGRFHTHELPFMLFATPEALARAIVNKLEWKEPHGHSQKPAKTQRS